jgi:hypothetical protein
MKNNTEFNVGDIAIKRYGSKPFRIVETYSSWKVVGRYLHNNNMVYASKSDIVHYDGEVGQPAANVKTLYSFADEMGVTQFGVHVGTNSQNLYILEVKGRDDYVVKDPKELEEVLPYTFSVKVNNKETHFIGEPGKLSVGDWLIMEENSGYSIVQVQAVDTKSKGARSKFKGRKIVTEAI